MISNIWKFPYLSVFLTPVLSQLLRRFSQSFSSLDPSDCGCPGGQGPSADYHEAADWIVFLIPGGWPLQEHPNTGVWLSSTGQTSVTCESNYSCTRAPTAGESPNMTIGYVQSQRKLGFIVTFPLLVSSWRGLVLIGNTAVISFWQIMKYSEQRIPTLNEYCVVCDEQHVFQNGSMLKVTWERRSPMYCADPVAHFKRLCYIKVMLSGRKTVIRWQRVLETAARDRNATT